MDLMLVFCGSFILISSSVLAQDFKLKPPLQQVNLGENADFECIYEGTDIPFWLIRDRLYNIFDLPDGKYVYAGGILTVKLVDENDNGTQIQCVFATRVSNIVTLNVSTNGTNRQGEPRGDIIRVHYYNASRNQNGTDITWHLEDSRGCSNNTYGLKAYTLDEIQNPNTTCPQDSKASLSTDETVYWRITAKDENGAVCSNNNSRRTYYRFISEETQTQSFNKCLPPPPDSNDGVSISWPDPVTSKSYTCLLSKFALPRCSSLQRETRYNISLCGEDSNSVSFEPRNSSDTTELDVAFILQQDFCSDRMVGNNNCFVRTVIASYKLNTAQVTAPATILLLLLLASITLFLTFY